MTLYTQTKFPAAVAALLFCLCCMTVAPAARADGSASATHTVADIWSHGDTELYFPVHTYHIRSAYDPSLIASFNETPWGIGFGKGLKDADGNWRGLYAMAFQDSHRNTEPIAGYGYLKPVGSIDAVQTSIGFTLFVTARQDIDHYLPIPGVLPMAALEYKKASIMVTWLPGYHNDGNIFFFLTKFDLGQ